MLTLIHSHLPYTHTHTPTPTHTHTPVQNSEDSSINDPSLDVAVALLSRYDDVKHTFISSIVDHIRKAADYLIDKPTPPSPLPPPPPKQATPVKRNNNNKQKNAYSKQGAGAPVGAGRPTGNRRPMTFLTPEITATQPVSKRCTLVERFTSTASLTGPDHSSRSNRKVNLVSQPKPNIVSHTPLSLPQYPTYHCPNTPLSLP